MRQRSNELTPHFSPERLRQLRLARGLTLDALCDLTGILRPNLIVFEQGRHTPGIGWLTVLAKTLEVDPWELTTVDPATATLGDLRVRAGLTKADIAAHLGITRNAWWQIERGNRGLQPDRAERVAQLIERQTRARLPADAAEVHLTGRDIQAARQRGLE